ncbi:MAG: multicopper oxidase domain-containing protein [Gammaproteobacteria bacterium]
MKSYYPNSSSQTRPARTQLSSHRLSEGGPVAGPERHSVSLHKSVLTIGILAYSLTGSDPSLAAEYNIPTATVDPVTGLFTPEPSPLCINDSCATPFTAKLLLFEEFGLKPVADMTVASDKLPVPVNCDGIPEGAALDHFLDQDLNSVPTEMADESASNPWDAKIKDCLGLAAEMKLPADGRPTGEYFAHQRWDEFYTNKDRLAFFQTAMTGSRTNGGLRDKRQLHNYDKGEFAPGGLYYLDADGDGEPGSKGIVIKMHPNLPTQDPTAIWTFDGTLPPKLLMARYGESILFRHHNALQIDPGANAGFGWHTISTHEHNGHNPAESDGYMHAYFYPGQYYDYHWPMVLAGHDSINTDATDRHAGAPDGNGGIIRVPGDWHETMSTHWFHDHMLDYTAQNVYKGNAAMMNYYSAVDRGNEAIDDGINLRFPSGNALDWGNRDYDMNLLVADKAWDNDGQLKFNIFNSDGYLGDRVTVNWIYKPYVEVRARRYRFRILNGSVSRYFKIAIVDEAGNVVPSYMIANDGNIMEHAVAFPNSHSAQNALPTQAIAERYDIIVDFKGMEGKKVYLVNIMEHIDGRGPNRIISLPDVVQGKYIADGNKGDPAVGKFLEFRVKEYEGTDLSMNPAEYQETVIDPATDKPVPGKSMVPLNRPTRDELETAIHRTFDFGRSGDTTDSTPWTIKTDGGDAYNADPHRVSAAPELPVDPSDPGKVEIWHFTSSKGWSHPVHVHFEEGQIIYRGGREPPPWEKYTRKDVYRVGGDLESTGSVDIAIRTREFAGTYVEHCHNTQHEDKAMLLRWDVEHPGQTLSIPAPMPDWDGVQYDPSIAIPTYKIGDEAAKQAFKLP